MKQSFVYSFRWILTGYFIVLSNFILCMNLISAKTENPIGKKTLELILCQTGLFRFENYWDANKQINCKFYQNTSTEHFLKTFFGKKISETILMQVPNVQLFSNAVSWLVLSQIGVIGLRFSCPPCVQSESGFQPLNSSQIY